MRLRPKVEGHLWKAEDLKETVTGREVGFNNEPSST